MQELQKDHSKNRMQAIADFVLQDRQHFVRLMDIFLSENHRLVQRASWPVGIVVEKKAEWLYPYLPQVLQCIARPPHDAVSHNIYRGIQFADIPTEYNSALLDLCFRDLQNPNRAMAIKLNAMSVAFNIAQKHPEILPELKLVIAETLPNAKMSYIARARKILAAIGRNATVD